MKTVGDTWFSLDQIIESVLADVIAADANFQLTQTKAWSEFSKSLNELQQIPTIDSIDLGLGFGRLENLGLSELSINLPLEAYRPNWFKRSWWGLMRLFVDPPDKDQHFRVVNGRARNVIEMQIKARRNDQGGWTIDKEANTS
ncbi:hypothetical protein SAMN02745866_00857 [Alteromonadaceae bacterium Bs31]|nr:hypothetical protein SAMN02745866_00857 [Alteromonadaceae bacterium Bs31]